MTFNPLAVALLAPLLVPLPDAIAQPVRVDFVDNMFKCKDVVVYNNSSQAQSVVLDWEYTFQDGEWRRGSVGPMLVPAGDRRQWPAQDAVTTSKCPQVPYRVKVLNYRWTPVR